MKRLLCMLVAMMLIMGTVFCVGIAADEEETTPECLLPRENVASYWNDEFISCVTGKNQTSISFSEEGLVFTYDNPDGAGVDPYVTFSIINYFKKVDVKSPKPEEASYIVLKLKAEGCDGTIEVFTQSPSAGDSGTASYESNGEWEYVFVDMSWTSLIEQRRLTTIRIDWSAGTTEEGATMTIAEIAFFADEDEAYNYIDGLEPGETRPETEPPATEPATEAPTDAKTEANSDAGTKAPEGESKPVSEDKTDEGGASTNEGCASVVIGGMSVILMAVGAAFVSKKH